jgi:hypothetical protein
MIEAACDGFDAEIAGTGRESLGGRRDGAGEKPECKAEASHRRSFRAGYRRRKYQKSCAARAVTVVRTIAIDAQSESAAIRIGSSP